MVLAAAFALPAASGAQAEDPNPASEIVYRSSLGSAADITFLVRRGASPNQTNDQGVPVLALAASRKDTEGYNVVEQLIANGADINARDKNGQTALFYAAKQGNKKIAQLLLEKGINYYIQDNNGDVARNVAYRSGQQETGALMDKFVTDQTNKVHQQYQEANDLLQKRYQEEVKRYQEMQEQQAASQASASSSSAPQQSAPEASQPPTAPPQASPPEAPRTVDTQEYKTLAQENCKFQYWSYVHDTGQSSELSETAILDTIDASKHRIVTLEAELTQDTQQPKYIKGISDSARRRIYNVLNAMPSKTYRHEHGVGNAADMQRRCDIIARQWDTPTPQELAKPPAMRGGGGIGGKGGKGSKNGGQAVLTPFNDGGGFDAIQDGNVISGEELQQRTSDMPKAFVPNHRAKRNPHQYQSDFLKQNMNDMQ